MTSAESARRWMVIADGRRLRELRRANGMSRRDLAARARVSVSVIARLEGEARTSCRGRTIGRLAIALGIRPTEVLAPAGISTMPSAAMAAALVGSSQASA